MSQGHRKLELDSQSQKKAPLPKVVSSKSKRLVDTHVRDDSRVALQSISCDSAEGVDTRHESLRAAFDFFNETSKELSNTYSLLEKKIDELTEELDQVSAEKDEEHRKKEQIANRMQALLDFLPGGVIVLDAHGYITESNPAAEKLLNTNLNGKLWRKVIAHCFSPRNDDGLEVSTKEGLRISIATSSLVDEVTGNNGQIILLTDQSETRKLQQNLSRYERLSAMGKMVSALAHQIRTPLSAALLYASHLCESDLENERREEFSHKVLSRLQHMERQVRDMMLFVKSELPLNDVITIADLEEGLEEAVEIPLMTTSTQCQWVNSIGEKVLRCHREALISALTNLVNNAIQACGEKGNVVVEFNKHTKNEKDTIKISVSDDGPGIDKAFLASAKELFVTTKPQGTGLGLAVVQAVARAHGGAFHLDSELGKGTVATIELPLLETDSESN